MQKLVLPVMFQTSFAGGIVVVVQVGGSRLVVFFKFQSHNTSQYCTVTVSESRSQIRHVTFD